MDKTAAEMLESLQSGEFWLTAYERGYLDGLREQIEAGCEMNEHGLKKLKKIYEDVVE